MPRATCRCGQILTFPVNGPDRVVCPKCESRIRVRREPAKVEAGDGFVRFNCPCGQRLKVRAETTGPGMPPQAGKCPECGRVVPVPASSSSSGVLMSREDLESPTEEMDARDLAAIELWSRNHIRGPEPEAEPEPVAVEAETPVRAAEPEPPVRSEAGLRVCPRCGRPLHLSAVNCRECGAPVPKR